MDCLYEADPLSDIAFRTEFKIPAASSPTEASSLPASP
jgi:hypothetical protein